ncbi:hypothetical protein [Shewanella algae]|uniref:hypothetical protein n=1 Tax=Shewanella algae TaxID=38313 RepID=UPI00313F2481
MKNSLLEEIKSGKSTYSLDDYHNKSEFEIIVSSLEKLVRGGIIKAEFHRESTSGSRNVDLVYKIKLIDSEND